MSEAPTAARRGLWPHLRAALVALHVVAVLLAAAPAPGGAMRRAAWKDPTVQDELHAWAERLRGLGMGLDDDEFEDALWRFAVDFTQARSRVLRPFQPYYEYLGVHQTWRMFVAPHMYPSRLHIDLHDGDDWRPLYAPREADAAWKATLLDSYRMRSAVFRYAWAPYTGARRQLVQWLARQAAAEFPEATHLRVRYWKQRSPSPEQVRAGTGPEGRWTREQVVELAPLRVQEAP